MSINDRTNYHLELYTGMQSERKRKQRSDFDDICHMLFAHVAIILHCLMIQVCAGYKNIPKMVGIWFTACEFVWLAGPFSKAMFTSGSTPSDPHYGEYVFWNTQELGTEL